MSYNFARGLVARYFWEKFRRGIAYVEKYPDLYHAYRSRSPDMGQRGGMLTY